MRVKKNPAKKRFMAGLLAVVMLLSILPGNVFATNQNITATGALPGGYLYQLSETCVEEGATYLVTDGSNGTIRALTNQIYGYLGTLKSREVTANGGNIVLSAEEHSALGWTFSDGRTALFGYDTQDTNAHAKLYKIENGGYFLSVSPHNDSVTVLENSQYESQKSQDVGVRVEHHPNANGADSYYITSYGRYADQNNPRYLTYGTMGMEWYEGENRYLYGWIGRQGVQTNIYLYKFVGASNGETVTFTQPGGVMMKLDGQTTLIPTVTVGEETVPLSDCTVAWATYDGSVVSVSNGVVTAMGAGSTCVTATLSAVNGVALVAPIQLVIPVTVEDVLPENVTFEVEFTKNSVQLEKGDVEVMTGVVKAYVWSDEDEPTLLRTIEHPMSDCTFEWKLDETVATYSAPARNEYISVTANGAIIGRSAGDEDVYVTLMAVGGVTIPEKQRPETQKIDVLVSAGSDGKVAGSGYLHGAHIYLLDDDCIDDNSRYLIVNTATTGQTAYILAHMNQDNMPHGVGVDSSYTISANKNGTPMILVTDDSNIAWEFKYTGADLPDDPDNPTSQKDQHTEYAIVNYDHRDKPVYLYANTAVNALEPSETQYLMHVLHNHEVDATGELVNRGQYQIHPNHDHEGTTADTADDAIAWHLNFVSGTVPGFVPGGTAQWLYLFEHTGYQNGAEVRIELSPDSMRLRFNETGTLDPVVQMKVQNDAGEWVWQDVDLANCTVEFSSSNLDVATVVKTTDANGNVTVTVKADDNTYGMAEITARLLAVNGVELQVPIILNIPVTVQRAYPVKDGYELHNNEPVTVEVGEKPDFSRVHLKVQYDDGRTVAIYQDKIIENPETPYAVEYSASQSGVHYYTGPFLEIEDYSTAKVGYFYVPVTFRGDTYGGVLLNVKGEDVYEDVQDATEYPEYPEPGAVRIDKTGTEINFETTGVANVELTVAGISVHPEVDVILVSDASNSMAWGVNMDEDASEKSENGGNNGTAYERTKMYALAQSVSTFADVLLVPNEHGEPSNNTISLVTFGGYDKEHNKSDKYNYVDVTRTLLVGANNAEVVKQTINNIRVLHDNSTTVPNNLRPNNWDANSGSGTNYYISFDGGQTYGENYGGTNYDFAFMQTAAAIQSLKQEYNATHDDTYDESGRQIYVLFMTDGAPTHYAGEHYKYGTGVASSDALYVDAAGANKPYNLGKWDSSQNKRVQYTLNEWYNIIAGRSLYWAEQVYKTTGVADMFGIGFDIANGGFGEWNFTTGGGTPLIPVLEKLVSGVELDVYEATNATALEGIYSQLATKIRYAGTQANVTDVIDQEFTLQMAAQSGGDGQYCDLFEYGVVPAIEVRGYELWTEEEIKNHNKAVASGTAQGLIDEGLIGMRKEYENGVLLTTVLAQKDPEKTYTYKYELLERVAFNADGTEAYSNMIVSSAGAENILNGMGDSDENTITINAHHFTYSRVWNETTKQYDEKFDWHIGNITETEVALNYYVYLKGSLEGTEPAGVRPTNEHAQLDYIDINGFHATQTYPIPKTVWKGASTAYEFYLVNEAGQPVNRQGEVIPFANRIVVAGPYYEELYLNAGNSYQANSTIYAKDVVPLGYVLYDDGASYTVRTASGENDWGELSIVHPGENTGLARTTVEVSRTPDCVQSHVAFAVLVSANPVDLYFEVTPDRVVIDYGKPILIDILANEPAQYESRKPDSSETAKYYISGEIKGFTRHYEDFDLSMAYPTTNSTQTYNAAYGEFSIVTVDQKQMVKYTPSAFVDHPEQIFCVLEVIKLNDDGTQSKDIQYMVNPLTVIPATTMYYETDFADGVFSLNPAAQWTTVTDTVDSNANADKFQDDGRIGAERIAVFAKDPDAVNDYAVQTYGYDTSYLDDAMYSDGSTLFVNCPAKTAEIQMTDADGNTTTQTVPDATPSATAQFVFTGTGFEIISRTGAEQGLIRVTIEEDSGEYFRELKFVSVLNKSQSNLELYQIPVISVNDLPYNVYRVTISVFPENKDLVEAYSRGGQFCFDALRIFDPAFGNEIAEKAYDEDAEAQRVLTEVRSVLLEAAVISKAYEGSATGSYSGGQVKMPGMVFVDSTYSNPKDETNAETQLPNYNVVKGEDGKSTLVEDKNSEFDEDGIAVWYTDKNGTLYYGNPDHESGYATIAQYEIIGPNNEVYLDKGQAIAFKVEVTAPVGCDLASFDVGAKTIAPNSNGANGEAQMDILLVNTANATNTVSKSYTIRSATAQNYDLMSINKALDDGEAYVVISNSGTGILSITDIKAAFTTANSPVDAYREANVPLEPDAVTVEFTADASTLALAYKVLNSNN